jgi:serine O-acetyltransferase
MAGWRATRALMAADRARLRDYFGAGEPLWLHPGHLATVLHRLAHHLWRNRWRRAAHLLRWLNQTLTGADLAPAARIGKGLLVPNPQAVSVRGTLGENCTIMAHAGIGWALEPGGVRMPVIGDDVTLEPGALVLGAVTIGDRVRVGARCLVTTDLPPDALVPPLEWRAARA